MPAAARRRACRRCASPSAWPPRRCRRPSVRARWSASCPASPSGCRAARRLSRVRLRTVESETQRCPGRRGTARCARRTDRPPSSTRTPRIGAFSADGPGRPRRRSRRRRNGRSAAAGSQLSVAFEQRLDADVAQRRGAHRREDGAGRGRLLQAGDEVVIASACRLEEALHQRLVGFGDRLDERGARRLGLADQRARESAPRPPARRRPGR